ncbi:DUF2845 domain-containing protein [Cupriavidus sp. SW-Y-13]|uniref:DUF2845 domain-containing protein n=1 Tax=Cupriavidus sp. SW-Y-13 TaxID=2653854 RepID=UPI001365681E|nr:DUF2845 domain-containing protein [Cupriavidus sp. SW-Y-13]
MKLALKVVLPLSLIAASGSAFSESLRCGGNLAQIGDGKADIQVKCGEPIARYSSCKPLVVVPETKGLVDSASAACITVDEWTFAPGPGQFLTTLVFQDGKLNAIRYGDRIR